MFCFECSSNKNYCYTCTCDISADEGFVGLSPQERMKVRMQEKAKKKTAEKYSVEQLLQKVMFTTYPQKRQDPNMSLP